MTWRLAAVLRRSGVRVRLVRTRKPGEIVWQDADQVWAVPYRRETFARP